MLRSFSDLAGIERPVQDKTGLPEIFDITLPVTFRIIWHRSVDINWHIGAIWEREETASRRPEAAIVETRCQSRA